MNLYRISQSVNNDYDTYDSAVVCCETEDEARNVRPGGGKWSDLYATWAKSPDDVTVELIGTAISTVARGVVCASFNAG